MKLSPFGANCGVTNTLKSPTGKGWLRERVRGKASLHSIGACLAVAQVVSRQPLNAKGRVRSQASLRAISGKQSGTGDRVFSKYSAFSLCQYYFKMIYSHSFIYQQAW